MLNPRGAIPPLSCVPTRSPAGELRGPLWGVLSEVGRSFPTGQPRLPPLCEWWGARQLPGVPWGSHRAGCPGEKVGPSALGQPRGHAHNPEKTFAGRSGCDKLASLSFGKEALTKASVGAGAFVLSGDMHSGQRPSIEWWRVTGLSFLQIVQLLVSGIVAFRCYAQGLYPEMCTR